MVSYEVPIADVEVDTDDVASSGMNIAKGVAGFATLFGLTAAGAFLFQRFKAAAGVDSETNIPGV